MYILTKIPNDIKGGKENISLIKVDWSNVNILNNISDID